MGKRDALRRVEEAIGNAKKSLMDAQRIAATFGLPQRKLDRLCGELESEQRRYVERMAALAKRAEDAAVRRK